MNITIHKEGERLFITPREYNLDLITLKPFSYRRTPMCAMACYSMQRFIINRVINFDDTDSIRTPTNTMY